MFRVHESDPDPIGYLLICIQICLRDSLLQICNSMIPSGHFLFIRLDLARSAGPPAVQDSVGMQRGCLFTSKHPP